MKYGERCKVGQNQLCANMLIFNIFAISNRMPTEIHSFGQMQLAKASLMQPVMSHYLNLIWMIELNHINIIYHISHAFTLQLLCAYHKLNHFQVATTTFQNNLFQLHMDLDHFIFISICKLDSKIDKMISKSCSNPYRLRI